MCDEHYRSQGDTIESDLYCVTCEYNLRTLPKAGRCPECGTSVARSLKTRRSRAPVVTLVILVAAMVCGAVGPPLLGQLGHGPASHAILGIAFFGVLPELACCAGWLVYGPRHFGNRWRLLARVIRYTFAVLSLCIAVFWILAAYVVDVCANI